MAEPRAFKRIVLGLQPSAPASIMNLAVELADLLHLDLLGLFLEDTSLRDLASMPFAREFRLLEGGWRRLDLDRLVEDFELAARSTERMFAHATKGLPIRCQFEVIHGSTGETIASISRTDDIVMIVEPASPVGRATQQFSWLIEAAFQSAAAVLLVPIHIARTSGSVVAIVASPDDPSLDAAAAIAIAAREELVVFEAREGIIDDAYIRRLAADFSLPIRHLAGSLSLFASGALPPAFRQLRERLVVMTRGVFGDEVALTIAAARRAPVLVIEPPEMRPKATE
ncbi:MAG: hypothetical protein WD073_07240 [Xanthobacteraceae bacterium]